MESEDDLCGRNKTFKWEEDNFLQGFRAQAWDPRTMLCNLSFMEDKIHQLQDLVHMMANHQDQQQLITTDLTPIIIQLISTASSFLPTVNHNMSTCPGPGPFNGQPCSASEANNNNNNCCTQEPVVVVVEQEMKEEEDVEGENLPLGSYEILQLEKEEILAPHTHFCTICGKGFKRDANLRMHMRGHGDEYKTAAALAKPNKESSSEQMMIKRYSCPSPGCKRNKDHIKFQPLKTILCVKNHYKRTHCDKSFTCSRCHTKKFSVIADLKTHEKHCGRNKWLCSCRTTFSRKDKLFGHIALFQGHTPAIPIEETKPPEQRDSFDSGSNNKNNAGAVCFNLCSAATNANIETTQGLELGECLSPLSFETCSFGGFHEFPRSIMFDDSSQSSFQMFISNGCGFSPRNDDGGGSLSNIIL